MIGVYSDLSLSRFTEVGVSPMVASSKSNMAVYCTLLIQGTIWSTTARQGSSGVTLDLGQLS